MAKRAQRQGNVINIYGPLSHYLNIGWSYPVINKHLFRAHPPKGGLDVRPSLIEQYFQAQT